MYPMFVPNSNAEDWQNYSVSKSNMPTIGGIILLQACIIWMFVDAWCWQADSSDSMAWFNYGYKAGVIVDKGKAFKLTIWELRQIYIWQTFTSQSNYNCI